MKSPPLFAFLLAMILALGGAVGTIQWLEGGTRPAGPDEELRYLPSPALARRLAFGYEHLAADLMWIRTVQYFGKHLPADRRFPRLLPLLEVTVGLDPHFAEAYQYGALFLWLARDPAGAVAFLEEGYRQNPERWEMSHDLGRLYFLQLHDDAQALRWWTIARHLPGSPPYLPRFIARLHAKVGQVETALELWEAMERDPNTNEYWRAKAREEIERLRPLLRHGRGTR